MLRLILNLAGKIYIKIQSVRKLICQNIKKTKNQVNLKQV